MVLTLYCAEKSHALSRMGWNWGLSHGAQESVFNAPGSAGSTENFLIPQWQHLSDSQGIRVLMPSRHPSLPQII